MSAPTEPADPEPAADHPTKEKMEVEVYRGVTREMFINEIWPKRRPAVLKDIDVGPCLEKWKSTEYLCQQGGTEKVKIHVSPTSQMNFLQKNFLYRTLSFDEFIARVMGETDENSFLESPGEKYYLRSLGDNPRSEVADIKKRFPELAKDIIIPPFFDEDRFFSSVFRIGSPGIQLWTHYDVMDNLLIQVLGRKKVVLFSPQDALHLYLSGDKSEVMDMENPDLSRFPDFVNATPLVCHLDPGDVLFMPALWFHNVVSLDRGIAVNVFWKHLEPGQYDPKDVYGNKDPLAATRATQVLDRALKILGELPPAYRDFYARRMISRIRQKSLDDSRS